MTPEEWQAYQNQARVASEARPRPSPPAKKRALMNWPLALLLLGLGTVGGCVYSFGYLVDAVDFQPTKASTPSVGVLLLEEEITGSLWATEALSHFQNDDNIKGVVIRINSPGGAVAPCQEIYRAVKALKKPVVVSMGSVAASGGLYIAAGGDLIMANPGTITGSIGVIVQSLEFSEAMDKLGLKSQTIKSGPFKDTGSPFRSLGPEERELLQTLVGEVYEQFLEDLAAGRPKLSREEVRRLADGRIFSGAEARKLGLVDEIGGFEDAARQAAALGGLALAPGERPKMSLWNNRPGWWELLRGRLDLSLPPALKPGLSLKYLYHPNF